MMHGHKSLERFLFSQISIPSLGPTKPPCSVGSGGGCFSRVKRPERDIDSPPPSSAELRIIGARPILPVFDFVVGAG